MNKFKIILCILFLVIGLSSAFLTYNLANKDSFGNIESFRARIEPTTSAGSGVDSSNDGVAVGLGIISGFSFFSSALLLTSFQFKAN